MSRRLFAVALLAAMPVLPAAALCIQDYNIENTEIKGDSVILFHMRNGAVYENDLPYRCVGLTAATNGFTYEPTNPGSDELCDNLAQFRVNEPGGGAECLFGAFKRLK